MSIESTIRTIRIRLGEEDQAHQVICEPRRLIAYREDTIKFICEDGSDFAIHFHPTTPAYNVRFGSGPNHEKEANIRDDAPYGRYEFFVAVKEKNGGHIWTDDPDIIIPPRPRH
ncbi:MAG: hypothetical protein GTN73_03990 [Candidatus Aminicenantes bacterium]|nr:hypothetical protein [Candidatus Aminicenantes bacterium]